MLRFERCLLIATFAFAACGDDPPRNGDATETSPDGTTEIDGTETSPDGTSEVDATTPDGTDATDATDADTTPDTEVTPVESCDDPIPAPAGDDLCGVTAGSTSALLIRANLVMPDGLLERGALLVEDGLITCAGCDCLARPAAATATVFACPDAVVSPGLINGHDHIGYSQGKPATHGTVRYDHRNEWRGSGGVTVPGKPKIPGPPNDSALGDSWSELRQVLGGATSYFASGAAPGMTRNLDTASRLENLQHGTATYDTFPLGSSGVHASGCGEYERPSPNVLNAVAWVPHVAEGVNQGARNEQICLDGQAPDGIDLVEDNTAFIHGVGTTAADIAIFVGDGAGLVWSPRTNTDLYGFTAYAPLYHRLGGQIALGTDWTYSGSINMLRELECAEQWNARWNHYFTDAQLVQMATSWGANNLGFADVLGSLTPGKIADIAIWDGRENAGYRAILDAEVSDVALVMRGGTPPTIGGQTYFRRGRPLYGDANLVDALSDRQLDYSKYDPNLYSATDPGKKKLAPCETISVCTIEKKLCLAEQMEEKPSGSQFNVTYTYEELKAQLDPSKTYDAFFCGVPDNEPTCIPSRPGEFDGIGGPSDQDGDGVADSADNCPGWHNAIRPLDGGQQPDTDGDGDGDICDPCPFDADTTACTSVDPDDIDGDGVINDVDKCPSEPDDQADTDLDGIGNACDDCPDFSNLGGKGCPAEITAIKMGTVAQGRAVSLSNVIVTAVGPDFYTIQANGPTVEYGGLYVFTGSSGAKPTVGQLLDVSGTVDDYFGQTQLGDATFTVLPNAGTLPEPLLINPADAAPGGAKEEAYEALFVEVRNVTVTDTSPTPAVNGQSTEDVAGEFEVTGGLRIDDALYAIDPAPTEGQTLPVIRGVIRYAWSKNKLLPRGEADVESGPAQLLGFASPTIALYADTTANVQVSLTKDADAALTVSVASEDPAVATVTASIAIAAGERSGTIVITGVSAGTTTITATYGDVERTLEVTVYAADAQPKVVSLEAEAETLSLGGTTIVTVTLDLPAKPGGTPVALTTTGAIDADAQVIVPAGENSAEIEVTAGAAAGAGSLTASAGGGSATVDFDIVEAPAVGLVLGEVYYNPTGADDGAEWVKLFNGSGAAIDLSGYSLSWRGADFTNGGGKLQLSGTIAAGECFIVGGPTVNSGISAFDLVHDFEPDIQNAGTGADEALDGVSLYNVAATTVTTATTPIDVVAWGTVNTNNLLGPNGPLTTSNAPVVNGQSVRRVSLTLWEAATPSADCITLAP